MPSRSLNFLALRPSPIRGRERTKRSLRLKFVFCFWVMSFSTILPTVCTAESARMEKLAPFVSSRVAWQERAEAIRNSILAGAELSPLPARTPLNALFSNRRVRRSYTVEDVAFEGAPGFYVSGNLYRPLHLARK